MDLLKTDVIFRPTIRLSREKECSITNRELFVDGGFAQI
jgi:hypothetical protein